MSPNLLLAYEFSFSDTILLFVIAFLLVCSAFFSACETSFSSVNSIRIKNYAENRVKGARKAKYILDRFDFALVCFLVVNNLVNIANTTICAYIIQKLIKNPTIANLVNTVLMTIIILAFTEILPKAYAKHNPEKFAMRFSGLIVLLMKIVFVIAYPFYKLQKLFIKEREEVKITEDEFESIVDSMENQGVIDENNAEIIHGAMDIIEKTVYDIFVPRVDMLAVSIKSTKEEIKDLFSENEFSRIPVYDGDKDNIVGILNYKDFFVKYFNENFDLKSILTEPLKVTKTMNVNDLIKIMQKEKKHLAIVVDEYGGTSGIVTMEDALEEMVGEIYDEHDSADDFPIKMIDENNYSVGADVSVEDLFEFLKIEHLPETKFSSVGGMIYELAPGLPKKGTSVVITVFDDVLDENKENYITINYNLKFVVDVFEDDRIQKVIVSIEKNITEEN